MAKIIITYPNDLMPDIALSVVQEIIDGGRVSEARGRKQYCFYTIFKSSVGELHVLARQLAYDGAPDSFIISRE